MTKLPPEYQLKRREVYAEFGRYLWYKIDKLTPEDRAELRAYTYLVHDLESAFDEQLAKNYARELSLWLGLKEDILEKDVAARVAKQYGKDIKDGFPEVFENRPR